ncbi:MAG: hypothetical protein U1E73_04670 [Planctomycetota bacterium]
MTPPARHTTAPPPGRIGWAVALALAACSAPPAVPPPNSPPAPAAVRDGMGQDVDVQSTVTSLFANWDPFFDPEGKAVTYEWSLGTRPGTVDVMPWRSVGGSTQASVGDDQVALPTDRVLYVNVRATDLDGNTSAVSTSDGVVLGQAAEPDPSGGSTRRPTQVALERFGVTWTFANPVDAGRFANGDWWVKGPVDIVAIAPPCRTDGGRTLNGAMLDPDPRSPRQGYDSAMFGDRAASGYDEALNVARSVSPKQPLHLEGGHSLVSAISLTVAGAMPQLETCAVLTVLAEAPPADAFRPPYSGTDKACRWRTQNLDLTRLPDLEAVPGAPDIRDLATRFERTWLDHVPGWSGRFLHPTANMPDYGREMADLVGNAGLALQLRQPETQKRELALRLVQLGIDNHGVVAAGGRFVADGGSGSGRKFPVLLAAALLQDDLLMRTAHAEGAFAEDVQTFIVRETQADEINFGQGGYDVRDVGLPEWGQRHCDDPRDDRKPWTADPYRRCCTANAWCGFVLATRIMGLREAWGHDALFAYVDRYMQVETKGSWTRAWTPFAEHMWDRYRSEF